MHVCSSLKHLLKLIHFRTYHIILASSRLWHQLLSHGTQYVWKIINIYSTSVRFWDINIVAEIYVYIEQCCPFILPQILCFVLSCCSHKLSETKTFIPSGLPFQVIILMTGTKDTWKYIIHRGQSLGFHFFEGG